jgi:hypothetical protein
MTHCALVSVVERSCSITGIATLSAVESLAMTKTPSAIATSANQVLRSSRSSSVSFVGPRSSGRCLPWSSSSVAPRSRVEVRGLR